MKNQELSRSSVILKLSDNKDIIWARGFTNFEIKFEFFFIKILFQNAHYDWFRDCEIGKEIHENGEIMK